MIYIETTTTTTTKVTTTTFFFFSLSSFLLLFFSLSSSSFFFFGISTYYIIVHFYSSSYLAVRINYYNNPPTYPRTQDSKDSRTQGLKTQGPLIRLRSGRAGLRAQGSGLSQGSVRAQSGRSSVLRGSRGQIKRIFNKKKNIRTHSYTTTGIYSNYIIII